MMAKILFDIKSLQPIMPEDKLIFANDYVDQEAYDLEDNEFLPIYYICKYLEDKKICLFYSPFENNQSYYPSTALDFFVLDSYEKIDKIILKENFSYNLGLGETDENASFDFNYNGDKVTVVKNEIFNPNNFLYMVEYTYEEFYKMMKTIYNYLYSVAEQLLPTIYFDSVIAAKILRIFP